MIKKSQNRQQQSQLCIQSPWMTSVQKRIGPKKYKSSQGSGSNGQTLTSSESFNNFLYWRDPLPVLDDLDDLKKGEAQESSSEVNRTAESEDEAVASPETDNSGEKKDATDTSTMELF